MIQKPIDLYQLQDYQPWDDLESSHFCKILAYAHTTDAKLFREDTSGHFTASSFILNVPGTHALLLYHEGLGRWLQPGGHVEFDDESFFSASEREMEEETTLKDLHCLGNGLFDLDVHSIPAKPSRGEGEHFHYDIRFLFQIPSDTVFQEKNIILRSMGLKWVPLTELMACGDESMARMARKAQYWIQKAQHGSGSQPPFNFPI